MNRIIALLATIAIGLVVGGCADYGYGSTQSSATDSNYGGPSGYVGTGYYDYPQPGRAVYYNEWHRQHPHAGSGRPYYGGGMPPMDRPARRDPHDAAMHGQRYGEQQQQQAEWELKKRQSVEFAKQQQEAAQYQAQQAAKQYQQQQANDQYQQRQQQAVEHYQQRQQQADAEYQARQAAKQYQQQQAVEQYQQRQQQAVQHYQQQQAAAQWEQHKKEEAEKQRGAANAAYQQMMMQRR